MAEIHAIFQANGVEKSKSKYVPLFRAIFDPRIPKGERLKYSKDKPSVVDQIQKNIERGASVEKALCTSLGSEADGESGMKEDVELENGGVPSTQPLSAETVEASGGAAETILNGLGRRVRAANLHQGTPDNEVLDFLEESAIDKLWR
eukprot:CAMPEP_0173459794 /NCGR_PEP_ID=MMETSP1357-20121228/62042_1 /TAXON_ID=77926 /ORGANISM="Hemiselmis rufescens, Strain PCC563" /LENGTH=147 /DNA_ID=CAMNT_0014427291 /DNA_START=166 /DNA_END=605 /DNA_ORIENTATION=-